MSQETAQSQVVVPHSSMPEIRKEQPSETTLQSILESLRKIQENAGQISELGAEEKRLISEFFSALLKVTLPLTKTIPVSVDALLQDFGEVSQASLDCSGCLLILRKDGNIESINITKERHIDSLGKIVNDVLPKIEKLVASYRERIETRINLLSSVTRELQKVAKVFSDISDQRGTP